MKDSSIICTSSTVISTSSTTITTPGNILVVSDSSISQCPSTIYDNFPLHSFAEDQTPESVSISDKGLGSLNIMFLITVVILSLN